MSGKKLRDKAQNPEPKTARPRLKFVSIKQGHKWGVGVEGKSPTITGLTELEAKKMVERCNGG